MRDIETIIDLIQLIGWCAFTIGMIYLPGTLWAKLLIWIGVLILSIFRDRVWT